MPKSPGGLQLGKSSQVYRVNHHYNTMRSCGLQTGGTKTNGFCTSSSFYPYLETSIFGFTFFLNIYLYGFHVLICGFSWVAGSTYRHVMTHMTGGHGHPEQLARLGEMAAEASVSSALESWKNWEYRWPIQSQSESLLNLFWILIW